MWAMLPPELLTADISTPCKNIHIHVINRDREYILINCHNLEVEHDLLFRSENIPNLVDVNI
jgi:hypothetical protein